MRVFRIVRPPRRRRTIDVPFLMTVTTPHINVQAVGVCRVGTDTVRESGRRRTVRTSAREARQLRQVRQLREVLRHFGLSTR
jgi:hypothetical protein